MNMFTVFVPDQLFKIKLRTFNKYQDPPFFSKIKNIPKMERQKIPFKQISHIHIKNKRNGTQTRN